MKACTLFTYVARIIVIIFVTEGYSKYKKFDLICENGEKLIRNHIFSKFYSFQTRFEVEIPFEEELFSDPPVHHPENKNGFN